MAEDPGRQLADHRDLVRRVEGLLPRLHEIARRLVAVHESGGRLYTFGNGGSAADAQHLAAELVGRYLRERRPLPALALTVDASVTTCIGNDYDVDDLFSRQVEAFAGPADTVIAFTTSGRSENVVRGLKAARERGALTVLFGGGDAGGGPAAEHADLALLCGAPEDVDLAPTSEDGYIAVMAYTALLEAADPSPSGARLGLARRAADWMLTFRYTYDVAFSPRTLLGRHGFRTRGGDQASPSNQHLHAYGLVCLPEMIRLARRTGDPYYLRSTVESLDCFRQFAAREDGDFDAYRGMVSERYYQTACFQPEGILLTLSHAWSGGLLLYACEAALGLPEFGEVS